MKLLWCALIIIAAYIFFSVAPSVTTFLTVFTRKTGCLFTKRDVKGTYFEKPYPLLTECLHKAESYPSENTEITAFDGTKLTATFYDRGSDKTVIFVHGYNTVPMNNFAYQLTFLYEHGFNCILINERAHSGSGGKRSGLGALEYRDVISWAEYASAFPNVTSVLIYGMSMGCTSVAYASDKLGKKVKAMVLDCGYLSPYEQIKCDMKKRHIPPFSVLPVLTLCCRLFLKIDIKKKVTDSLKNTTVPALFIHGTKDTTVPFEVGKANYESCVSQKRFLSAPADHTMALVESVLSGDTSFEAFINDYFG